MSVEKRRILIVDDEKVIADILAVIFLHNGYEARAVYPAAKALAMMPEWRPDLVILDVVMPGMNGIDLAIFLRSEYSECRLSLFSGQSTTADLMEKALEKGHSFDILPKPIHPTAFLALASRLLSTLAIDYKGAAKAGDLASF